MDTTSGSDVATRSDALRAAKGAGNANGAANTNGAQSDLARWLIIGAALLGAFLLTRSARKFMQIAIGFFWIWFWTHGAWRWIF